LLKFGGVSPRGFVAKPLLDVQKLPKSGENHPDLS
jgi:hypothetical protein